MADQTRKMSPPKKPVERKPRGLLELGGTPARMIAMYLGNRAKRKAFEEETVEYEKKKKAYDAAMRQLNENQKQKRASQREAVNKMAKERLANKNVYYAK